MFELNPRLKNDTIEIAELGICKVLLAKDANYPWVILVPTIENATEMFDLSKQQQLELTETISLISENMKTDFKADKINVAAIGNVVKQLHIHIVARYENDIAWPNPIWGHSPAKEYKSEDLEKTITKIKNIVA